MEQQIRSIIQEVFHDLQACCAESGERLCAEGLADAIADRMYDSNPEYRAMSYEQRAAVVLRICKQYV